MTKEQKKIYRKLFPILNGFTLQELPSVVAIVFMHYVNKIK